MAAIYRHFESEPCRRCGGSGTFSYNQKDGSTCYGCGSRSWEPGSGWGLTVLGRKAHKAYAEANTSMVPAETVEAGMAIRSGGRLRRVVEVERGEFGWGESNGVRRDFTIAIVVAGSETCHIRAEGDMVEVWTQRVPLPPEAEPGTDRKAEMRAIVKACAAVVK